MSTIGDPQVKGAVLNSTLTTNLLEAAAGTRIRIDHITISNGATGGNLTLSVYDSSPTPTTYEIFNAYPVAANNATSGNIPPIELTTLYLEAGDQIRGGITTSTDAKITFHYFVITL